MRFKNKVMIVTGSSRGIGAETAKLLADEGAAVVINCRERVSEAQKVAEEIGKNQAIVVQADVTEEAGVKKLVGETLDSFGRIDGLINNAGEIVRPSDWQGSKEGWQKNLDINVTAAWLMCREVGPIMKRQKAGVIVNLTSVFGMLGAAAVLPYTVAKGGLITLTQALAKELAPEVRVNAVAPSVAMTEMTKGGGEELIEFFRKKTPLARIAEPIEIARAIVFLASDEASYITGETLRVDGGYYLK